MLEIHCKIYEGLNLLNLSKVILIMCWDFCVSVISDLICDEKSAHRCSQTCLSGQKKGILFLTVALTHRQTKKDSSSSLISFFFHLLLAPKQTTNNSCNETTDHDEVELKQARRILRWAGIKPCTEDFLVAHDFTKWYLRKWGCALPTGNELHPSCCGWTQICQRKALEACLCALTQHGFMMIL